MKICFFTNTFLPHVGGVARSVQTFLEDYRRARHRVLVVAPEFAEGPAPRHIERSVLRVPALQQFNGSDFSVSLPLGSLPTERVERFAADIIHAHHPFLLGDTALRLAAQTQTPVVFTHHTLYEQYTHYVPFDSPKLKEFVIELSTRFANCCQGVIAPSQSIAALLVSRGVTTPIEVIPTGIDTRQQASGTRARWRRRFSIPPDAPVIGHVGRLAPEKNLGYLAEAIVAVLRDKHDAHAIVVGDGPSRAEMSDTFGQGQVADRVHFTGKLSGKALVDAYAALDLFLFASQSETQGMVIAEAMAAGLPVVALDASGVREMVDDGVEGRLLASDTPSGDFAHAALQLLASEQLRAAAIEAARQRAAKVDRAVTSSQAIEFYRTVRAAWKREHPDAYQPGTAAAVVNRIAIEGRLVADKVGAAVRTLTNSTPETASAMPS